MGYISYFIFNHVKKYLPNKCSSLEDKEGWITLKENDTNGLVKI